MPSQYCIEEAPSQYCSQEASLSVLQREGANPQYRVLDGDDRVFDGDDHVFDGDGRVFDGVRLSGFNSSDNARVKSRLI